MRCRPDEAEKTKAKLAEWLAFRSYGSCGRRYLSATRGGRRKAAHPGLHARVAKAWLKPGCVWAQALSHAPRLLEHPQGSPTRPAQADGGRQEYAHTSARNWLARKCSTKANSTAHKCDRRFAEVGCRGPERSETAGPRRLMYMSAARLYCARKCERQGRDRN